MIIIAVVIIWLMLALKASSLLVTLCNFHSDFKLGLLSCFCIIVIISRKFIILKVSVVSFGGQEAAALTTALRHFIHFFPATNGHV